MTSMLVRVSRFPVGSSASRIDGLLISARAIATRCCCPPDSWFGWWSARLPSPTSVEHLERALVPFGRLQAVAAVEQRQLDVVERRGARQQVEALEHEPDLLVAHGGQRVLRHRRHVLAVEQVLARRRPVEAADDVHERRLARARRSGDREELAALHFEVDAAQRLHLDLADDVGLDEVLDRDDRGHGGAASRGPCLPGRRRAARHQRVAAAALRRQRARRAQRR